MLFNIIIYLYNNALFSCYFVIDIPYHKNKYDTLLLNFIIAILYYEDKYGTLFALFLDM